MMAMMGNGIFTQDSPAWKHSRELLRQHFVRIQYQNLEGFREHVDNLINTLSDSRGYIDLQPHFFCLTLNTTIAMILGQLVENFNQKTEDTFSEAFNEASMVTATRVRLGDLYFLYAPRGFHVTCSTVEGYIEQFVKEALQEEYGNVDTPDKYKLINRMQEQYKDVQQVRDQVINMLIAGRDTTAATMSYVL